MLTTDRTVGTLFINPFQLHWYLHVQKKIGSMVDWFCSEMSDFYYDFFVIDTDENMILHQRDGVIFSIIKVLLQKTVTYPKPECQIRETSKTSLFFIKFFNSDFCS